MLETDVLMQREDKNTKRKVKKMKEKVVEIHEIQNTFDTEFELVSEEMEENNESDSIYPKANSTEHNR